MSFWDEITKGAGTVADAIKKGADIYDQIMTDEQPRTVTNDGVTQPAQPVGVDTTQTQASPTFDMSMGLVLIVVALVFFLAVKS